MKRYYNAISMIVEAIKIPFIMSVSAYFTVISISIFFNKINFGIYTIFPVIIIVFLLIFYFDLQKREYKFERIEAVRPNSWRGERPLLFSAPAQGVILRFEAVKSFVSALNEYVRILQTLRTELPDNTPDFLKMTINQSIESIEKTRDAVRLDNYEPVAHLESDVQAGLILLPPSYLGKMIFRDDLPIALRLLGLTMFFKTRSRDKETALAEHKEEFFNAFPDLRANGESQVLYRLALDTSAVIAEIQRDRDEINELKNQLITALRSTRSTLRLAPAAARWRNNSRFSSLLALVGLSPFLLILGGILWNLGDVWTFVSGVARPSEEAQKAIHVWQEFFRDAPWATFVLVTVPALAIAWSLKHFSRIFVQNMNLAADASNRAALADVYTRIVSDPALNTEQNPITPEQKAIIFEAMFRPRDARHTDEGIDHTPMEKLIDAFKKS